MAVVNYYKEQKTKPIESCRPTLSKQELESVLDALIQDRLGSGELTRRFERSFAGSFHFKHSLAVNSLTSAYHLAFLAMDPQDGDTIIMSALAPVAAYDAARYVNLNIALVDVARNSFHPETDRILEVAENIKTETDRYPTLFLMDHTFGSLSPVDGSRLQEKGMRIIEDFTGLVGTDEDEYSAGSRGSIGICGMSEQDLITTGNGAMLVTQDSKLQNRLQSLRYGGKRSPGEVAYDYRLEDFQSAMGLEQLGHLGLILPRRRKIGVKYLETLRMTTHETYFKKPGIDGFLKFPVIINKSKDEVKRYFASLQIGIMETVESPLHHIMGQARMEYPNAERLYQKSVSIPLYPNLTANNVERICSSLRGLV